MSLGGFADQFHLATRSRRHKDNAEARSAQRRAEKKEIRLAIRIESLRAAAIFR